MLTRTSELAVRAMVALATRPGREPISPRRLSQQLHCSPSYLAKVILALSRAGLLAAERGAHGGVRLARPPGEITLLDIVEVGQGLIVASYCQPVEPEVPVCGFHAAVAEVHAATVGILARWSLADLVAQPAPGPPGSCGLTCKMFLPPAP